MAFTIEPGLYVSRDDAKAPERFRGIRIFDISDLANPRQVAAVQSCRGSHTHTLVEDPTDPNNLYIYIQGTGGVRPADELPGCVSAEPEEDENTALFRIEVVRVPLAAPEQAEIVNTPRIFADVETGDIAGLGSDIFESYCGAMTACIALASPTAIHIRSGIMFLPPPPDRK